ncbi:hypothetical protein AB0F91_19105 [Amycolatopsis sp. NPDC023774]|uniref:hypothetical protein n=1 Tax=Amycolatopsis sp. NPDC023774 TaxID=3155015 RepID=UPI0033EE4715
MQVLGELVAVVPVVAGGVADGHLIGVLRLGQGGGLRPAGAEPLSHLFPSRWGELQRVVQKHQVEPGLVVPGELQADGRLARIGKWISKRGERAASSHSPGDHEGGVLAEVGGQVPVAVGEQRVRQGPAGPDDPERVGSETGVVDGDRQLHRICPGG